MADTLGRQSARATYHVSREHLAPNCDRAEEKRRDALRRTRLAGGVATRQEHVAVNGDHCPIYLSVCSTGSAMTASMIASASQAKPVRSQEKRRRRVDTKRPFQQTADAVRACECLTRTAPPFLDSSGDVCRPPSDPDRPWQFRKRGAQQELSHTHLVR